MIIVKLMGGLGNQMFQYAAGRSLSLYHNTSFKLDTSYLLKKTNPDKNFVFRNYDLDIFNVEETIATESECKALKKQLSKYKIVDRALKRIVGIKSTFIREPHFNFYPELFSKGDNLYLDGYWQSEKYFLQYETVIRKDFTFKKAPSANTAPILAAINENNAICVNVRRGDFVTNPVHGTIGIEYYKKGELIITERIKSPHFFIFSDDVEWCRRHLTFSSPVTFVTHEFAGEKFGDYLFLMTRCKHFIIPNSSFGWWAAWLSDQPGKTIIAPQLWFNQAEHDTKDLIPETWLRI